ncbi:MAG: S8 family serine peptidase [Candidatus Eisenbacteria sp.]|nr:S8 family serine peptidase [Candidatus Eisenbacteria bacterium]
MHVVASDEYLYCPDLTPVACDSINVDVSIAEILAANGYGYVAFVAYDVQGITGAEFAVTGWPTGRGAPALSGPYWCPDDALTLGNHLDGGGITSFPCEQASENGIVLIGYCSFGPLDEEDLPITLEYEASSFSYPQDPHNYVLDCTVEYREDPAIAFSGCTIGGVSDDSLACSDGDALLLGGIAPALASGNQTVTVEISGSGFGAATVFSLRRSDGTIIPANLGQTVEENTAFCSFSLARGDTGVWNLVAESGGSVGLLEAGFEVEGSASDEDAGLWPGSVIVHFRHGAIDLGGSRDTADREDIAYMAPAVESLVDSLEVFRVEKVFKESVPYDTLATARNGNLVRVEDVSQFYWLHCPEETDILAAVRTFRGLPEVIYAESNYRYSLAAVPNDQYVSVVPKQWGLHNTGQHGGTPNADIDALAAWTIETGLQTVRIFINDTGVDHFHPDLGAAYGPGHKVAGGYNFYNPGGLPTDARGHGTKVAGIAGALTNNRCNGGGCGQVYHGGAAGVAGGWGNEEGTGPIGCALYAVKVFPDVGESDAATIAAGLDYARSHGASVVNMSYESSTQAYVEQVAVHNCAQVGIVLVAAMGNCYQLGGCYDGSQQEGRARFPARYLWDVVSVGATDRDDHRVWQDAPDFAPGDDLWSSRVGSHIDVVAPSLKHWTTWPNSDCGKFGGTSAAAPFVSGIAALVLSYCDRISEPNCPMNVDDVAAFLTISADEKDEDPIYGYCPGWDPYTGAGRVNAFKALYLCDEPNGFDQISRDQVVGGTGTETGWGFWWADPPDLIYFRRYRVTRTVSFAFSDTPSVWGDNRDATVGTIPFPLTGQMLSWKYCRVVPNSVTPTQAQLETYVYEGFDFDSTPIGWFPTDPAHVVFGYSVMPPPVWTQGSVASEMGRGAETGLSQNYPNPFNPATLLVYSTREPCHVRVTIYDVLGREVIRLVDERKIPGEYSVSWDGRDRRGRTVAGGVYFCRMEAGDSSEIRKMVLAR